MKRFMGTIVVAGILATGCVSQKKYDALQAQLDATTRAMQTQIDDRDARIVDAEQALAGERQKVDQLNRRIEELGRRLTKAEADRVTLEQERAGLQEQLAETVRDKSKLKGSIEEMKEALADLKARKAAAEARIAEFRSLLDRFKPLIDTGKLKVKMVDGRMVVAMATDVLFTSGSAALSQEGKDAIVEVAGLLAAMEGRRFQIEGHTDDVPIRTAKFNSNWELASARATNVVKAMIDGGLPPQRVSAASFGEYKPTASNETKEDRGLNRRIEIVLVPDLDSLPGFDELKRMSEAGGDS
ncbi:MAG: OmpA family protein [Deltaproteobacteria bacterium]|nr:OmpA family protein [Deltaproteobacteria bacterium]